jgi:hypothetical protein
VATSKIPWKPVEQVQSSLVVERVKTLLSPQARALARRKEAWLIAAVAFSLRAVAASRRLKSLRILIGTSDTSPECIQKRRKFALCFVCLWQGIGGIHFRRHSKRWRSRHLYIWVDI